jgi:NADP-dependent 3-hydroxy acid dehydrogenase YdfG
VVSRNAYVHKTGCIINISSLIGLKGGQGISVYAASKAGIIGEYLFFQIPSKQQQLRKIIDSPQPSLELWLAKSAPAVSG